MNKIHKFKPALTITEMLEYFTRDHPFTEGGDTEGFFEAILSLIADGSITYDPFDRRKTRNGGTQGVLCAVEYKEHH